MLIIYIGSVKDFLVIYWNTRAVDKRVKVDTSRHQNLNIDIDRS